MAMNRQGVFISLTALLIVGSFMIIFTPEFTRTDGDAVERRLQNFAQDRASLEEQLIPATLRVHTRRSMNSLVAQHVDEEISIDDEEDLETYLRECIGIGMHHSEEIEIELGCGDTVVTEETLHHSIREIEQQYTQALQYDVKIVVNNIQIRQLTPWILEIRAGVTTLMNDSADFARYENTKEITTQLPIEGLIDPLASKRRGEKHMVRRTRVVNWTQEFAGHARSGGYIFDDEGPNYLDRLFERDVNEWSQGIHSLVLSSGQRSNVSSIDYETKTYAEECLVSIKLTGSQHVHLPAKHMLRYDQGDALDTPQQQYDQEDCEDSEEEGDSTEE